MSILRDFEKRLEGAVEGFFARAFRSGLQPVELAKALQRYASNYQQVGLDGVFVPNVYRFVLSPEDTERFSGFSASLRRELAEVVTRTATDRGWRLQGPVRVELVDAKHVRTGTYELRGKVEAPEPVAAGGGLAARQPGSTRVLPADGADAQLITADGQRFGLGPDSLVGRLPECDVTLDDPAVSRRHARILSDGVDYSVEDLGSTNGLRLNGEPVSRAVLRDGDQLDFGGVRATFSLGR